MIIGPYAYLMIFAFLIALFAQLKISGSYKKYSRIPAKRNVTGKDVAEYILRINALEHIRVTIIEQELGDHYDPKEKVLRLSPDVYNETSIASISIAAHEAGHALQDSQNYAWMKFRTALFPVASFGSQLGIILVMVGLFLLTLSVLYGEYIAIVGIILFIFYVLFTLLTLPVEFNASKRAIEILTMSGYLYPDEIPGVKAMLGAAAFTYVAAALVAILQLLQFVLIFLRRR